MKKMFVIEIKCDPRDVVDVEQKFQVLCDAAPGLCFFCTIVICD